MVIKKRANIIIITCLLCISFAGFAKEITKPNTFFQAKSIARQLFIAYTETIYSGCSFDLLRRIDFTTCDFEHNPNIHRDKTIEFEHMLPMSNVKPQFACWTKPLCTNTKGKKYGGRRCCQHMSRKFNQLEAELFNLWPEIGTINRIRSNYKFTEFTKSQKQQLGKYRGLPLHVDFKHKQIEPRDEAKGIVARASLFMAKKYHIALSNDQLELFNRWNQQYPPNKTEIFWAKQVARIEGYNNEFIIMENKRVD